jgi:hypothetical protein
MRTKQKFTVKLGIAALALISTFALAQTSTVKAQPAAKAKTKADVVFVCACLKTESCDCMTVSNREGPCACGTEGGPPLRPVAKNSNWAKHNLDVLAH